MLGGRVEQHTDAPAGLGERAVRAAEHVAWPASGCVSPTIIRSVVDLPAPLGPRNPVTVPGSQRERDVVHDSAAAESLSEAV